jgi:hypothetical protein
MPLKRLYVVAIESWNIQPGTKTICTSQKEKWNMLHFKILWDAILQQGMFPGISTLKKYCHNFQIRISNFLKNLPLDHILNHCNSVPLPQILFLLAQF